MGGGWTVFSSGASQWTTSGSNIYYSTGKVAIGTASPTTALTVLGAGAVTPSLTSDTGTLTVNNGGDLQLQVGQYNPSGGAGVFLQSKRVSNDGTSWDLYLNPLGGRVMAGLLGGSDQLCLNGSCISSWPTIQFTTDTWNGGSELAYDNGNVEASSLTVSNHNMGLNGVGWPSVGFSTYWVNTSATTGYWAKSSNNSYAGLIQMQEDSNNGDIPGLHFYTAPAASSGAQLTMNDVLYINTNGFFVRKNALFSGDVRPSAASTYNLGASGDNFGCCLL